MAGGVLDRVGGGSVGLAEADPKLTVPAWDNDSSGVAVPGGVIETTRLCVPVGVFALVCVPVKDVAKEWERDSEGEAALVEVKERDDVLHDLPSTTSTTIRHERHKLQQNCILCRVFFLSLFLALTRCEGQQFQLTKHELNEIHLANLF